MSPIFQQHVRDLMGWMGWSLLCFSAAGLGVMFLPGEWYASLKKPTWNPPGWVFGPVWTLLYAMMATAAWRVWRRGGWRLQGRVLLPFVVQLLLNALWTPLFFGWHQPALAFLEILLLWAAIVWTIRVFSGVDRWASLLLWPYLAWVSFAAVLNGVLWRLNR